MSKAFKKCDDFGQPISFNFNGEQSYKTCCGGMVSLLVKVVLLGVFGTMLLALKDYKDPEISTHTVYEERFDMSEPMNLKDNGIELFFFFTKDSFPVQLDPRVGSFKISQAKKEIDTKIDVDRWTTYTDIPVEEVDLSQNEDAAKILHFLPKEQSGVYSAADPSLLEI